MTQEARGLFQLLFLELLAHYHTLEVTIDEPTGIGYRAVEPHIWLVQVGSVGRRSDEYHAL